MTTRSRPGLQGLGLDASKGRRSRRRWSRKDFAAAMVFVNQVAELAEARNHHPDIAISWNKVTLTLSTHYAGGLTQLDLDLAAAIDALEKPA